MIKLKLPIFAEKSTNMELGENHRTPKKRYFDSVLDDYKTMVCQVISDYQAWRFGVTTPIILKKELMRNFGISADLARKIVDGPIRETSTMMMALDVMENILTLYDPANQFPSHEAQIKRKNYFYKRYVATVDMDKPIVQKDTAKKTRVSKKASNTSSEDKDKATS